MGNSSSCNCNCGGDCGCGGADCGGIVDAACCDCTALCDDCCCDLCSACHECCYRGSSPGCCRGCCCVDFLAVRCPHPCEWLCRSCDHRLWRSGGNDGPWSRRRTISRHASVHLTNGGILRDLPELVPISMGTALPFQQGEFVDGHAVNLSPLRAAYGVAGHDAVPIAYSALPPRAPPGSNMTKRRDDDDDDKLLGPE